MSAPVNAHARQGSRRNLRGADRVSAGSWSSFMNIDQAKLDALLGSAVSDLAAGYAGVLVSLGDKLGLYQAMAGAGPLNAAAVAARSGCAERYVREWLNAQAAGGYVAYDPAGETYELTPEQAMVFADRHSPVFMPHAWQVPASMWFDEAKAIDAFRTGRGVSWGEHDQRLYCGVAAFFRNSYGGSLISSWLPALDGVVAKLQRGIKVADVGCGHGHSSVIMAKAFPKSRFFGFDVHQGSIRAAKDVAAEAALDDRVSFALADATSYPADGYDLICFFDCLHDMGDPVAAACHAAAALAPGGSVLLVEPYADDRVENNLNPIGRLYYAASTTLCCAHAISEGGRQVLGAQAGEARLREVFVQAGFKQFRRATQTPFNLIFEVRF
jgi:SAM-dependent methyltransferase